MSTTNNTPAPVADTPKPDTTMNALFSALRLRVTDPSPSSSAAPVPDSGDGVEVVTDNRSKSSLAELLDEMKKNPPKPAEVIPDPAPAPVAVTPVSDPAVAPTPTPAPDVPKPDTKLADDLRAKMAMPDVTPPSPAPLASDPTPITLDTSDLSPDELEELQLASFAERRDPNKYRGLAKGTLDFIRADRAQRQRIVTETGSFSEDDDTYQNFLKAARPNISQGEKVRLEKQRLIEVAKQEAKAELETEQKKLREEVRMMKEVPKVEAAVKNFENYLTEVLPKDPDDRLLTTTAGKYQGMAKNAANEYMLISSKLKTFDENNGVHRWLAEFIRDQGKVFANSGSEHLKRGNKTFLPRAEFNSLPVDKQAQHFTFSDVEVLDLIAIQAKLLTDLEVKNERERREAEGYTRKPKETPAPNPVPAPVVPPTNNSAPSPRAGISPSPGVAAPVGNPVPSDPFVRFLRRA